MAGAVLCLFACSQDDIADAIGLNIQTIRL